MSRRIAWSIVATVIVLFFGLLTSAIAYPDNFFVRDTASVAPWAGGLAAIVLAALTALYVTATEEMARATKVLADETREARLASTRPAIVPELEADQSQLFWLTIRNVGNAVAYEFRVHCYPDLEMVSGKSLNSLPLFANGVPAIAPGGHLRTMINFAPRVFEAADKQGKPLQYNIRFSFKDDAGTKHGPYDFPIDFDVYRGLIPGEDVLKSIGKSLRDISDGLKDITSKLP